MAQSDNGVFLIAARWDENQRKKGRLEILFSKNKQHYDDKTTTMTKTTLTTLTTTVTKATTTTGQHRQQNRQQKKQLALGPYHSHSIYLSLTISNT